MIFLLLTISFILCQTDTDFERWEMEALDELLENIPCKNELLLFKEYFTNNPNPNSETITAKEQVIIMIEANVRMSSLKKCLVENQAYLLSVLFEGALSYAEKNIMGMLEANLNQSELSRREIGSNIEEVFTYLKTIKKVMEFLQ